MSDLAARFRDRCGRCTANKCDWCLAAEAANALEAKDEEIERLIKLHGDGADDETIARVLEQEREIERLREALQECGSPVETRPQVGKSIDYANGFRVGAQCQRLHTKEIARKALEK